MLNMLEYLLHGTGNDASLGVRLEVLKALHCEGLSCSRLTIGQNSRVVALQHRLDSWSRGAIIHKALSRIGSIDVIEGE